MNSNAPLEASFSDLKSLKLPYRKLQHLTVVHDGHRYHLMLYLRRRADTLLVLSNGAIDPAKKAPPVFMRSSWAESLPGSLIFIDDPTLHGTELKLGWGQGDRAHFALEAISEIVEALRESLKMPREHMFFYGSSAGGFMSMMLASMNEGTTAIVNNPQTDVLSYYESAVTPMLEHVYGTADRGIIMEEYGYRLNICEAFKHYGHFPPIHYFQNRLSGEDMKKHVAPFISNVLSEGFDMSRLYMHHYFDRDAGHGPLSREGTIRMLEAVMDGDMSYHI
ncbi:hypothetical protein [Salinicoccus roseus]|uniref:Uncharacterized protein n=1 Tax=Salinicoccus roseus TaxID=45670 RepID=A0A265E5M6_9STAP|nr:hypothetical protein [Salinicoccus roseus]OZT76899.1 hypothetical protein CFN03_07410 [Salinicoccus roseus]